MFRSLFRKNIRQSDEPLVDIAQSKKPWRWLKFTLIALDIVFIMIMAFSMWLFGSLFEKRGRIYLWRRYILFLKK